MAGRRSTYKGARAWRFGGRMGDVVAARRPLCLGAGRPGERRGSTGRRASPWSPERTNASVFGTPGREASLEDVRSL